MKRLLAAALLLLIAGGCSAMKSKPSSNVQPPAPGVPATASDVTGIYRSIHQGTLQLRADGDYILVVPEGPGATSGSFTLSAGRMSVYSEACGPETGDYDVIVTGEQEAGKAVLNISAVRDSCEERRRYLTIDPWVYANS
ncbi:MAG TPA: hypothetical protein VFK43_08840 [Acidimicrobiales bacterium]|nr:hypothetical protein [Acidimicrobiales bacterium]